MTRLATEDPRFTAFAGIELVASGSLREVVERVWAHLQQGGIATIAVFEDDTGDTVELDLRGSLEEILQRLPSPLPEASERRAGPGRPKLGVVSREVSLLPRHWEWLALQPGGASVALRKLVEVARKENVGKDRARRSRDAAHRFMWTMAGDFEGFEEASRALYASDYARLDKLVERWPAGVRNHTRCLIDRLVAAEKSARQPAAHEPGER